MAKRVSHAPGVGVADGEILVGMLARLETHEGSYTFLRAAARVAASVAMSDSSARVQGRPVLSRVRRRAEELGLASLVRGQGLSSIRSGLNAFDIFCFPGVGGGLFQLGSLKPGLRRPCVVTDAGDSALSWATAAGRASWRRCSLAAVSAGPPFRPAAAEPFVHG